MAKFSSRSHVQRRTINRAFLTVLALVAIAMPTAAEAMANRIVELEGKAQIKRKDSSEYRPAFRGYTLKLGDLLQPEAGAVVKVRCADRKLRQVPVRVPSGLQTICPGARSLAARDPDNVFLELLQDEFEYETLLLKEQPLLKWSPVPGATIYQASLMAVDETIWEQEVNSNAVRYTGPALQSGFGYRLVVEAVDSDASFNYELTLTQLEPVLAEIVQEEVAQIEAEEASQEAKALMLADYYREREPAMLLAAAEPLEALVEGNRTAVVHRLLGDIYVRLGRWQEAEARYSQALTLAEAVGNEEEEAAAQEGLAHVFVAKGKLTESREWLTQAKESYALSGSRERGDVVSEWLAKLTTAIDHQ